MRFVLLLGLLACLPAASVSGIEPAADRIDASRLAAITEEGNERARLLGANSSAPMGPAWRTLDPATLTQMLRHGQILEIPGAAHTELIDQALAWDVVGVRTPGDIKRFFISVLGPERFREFDPATENSYGTVPGFHADASAGAEGAALSALFHCLPDSAWRVTTPDPLLWSMQRGENIEVSNTGSFGRCVRAQGEDGKNPGGPVAAETSRGRRVAPLVAGWLATPLREKGCAGTGPDSCLLLLHALMSLDPTHPDLVAIVRRLQRETDALRPVAIPNELAPLAKTWDPALTPRYDRIRHELWRRGIVLSAELELMRAQPKAWRKREVRAATDAALALMLTWRRLDHFVNPHRPQHRREYGFETPWQHLHDGAVLPPVIAARVKRAGRREARSPGCASARLWARGQPVEFWRAYTEAKRRREGQECVETAALL